MSVAAIVVTRDRRELLRESLAAVDRQSRPAERLVVVDNASSDGTQELLREEFPAAHVVRLEVNQGATGGFCEGIAAGLAAGAQWLWLLDDDCFPRHDALEQLLAAGERLGKQPALLASRVEWRDGRPHRMNVPTVDRRDLQGLVDAVREGLLPLRATTWVSLLLSRQAVEDEEPPRRDFFYQGDDIEYTARLLRARSGYFVPESVVEHRTPSQQTATSDDRRFFFHARNNVRMLRGSAWAPHEKPALAWALARSITEHVQVGGRRPERLRNVVRAVRAGLGPSAP